MPPSAFPSPAVTAASRCCSASVRRTRFAASLRPAADRAAFYLTRSLPPSASSFERAPSAARTRQIRLIADSGKKAAKGAPGRPRRGLGYGLRVRSIQLPSRSATPCRRVPARAHPPEGRLRRAHQDAIFFRAVCFLRPGGNDGSALRRAPNPHPPLRECVPTLVGAN